MTLADLADLADPPPPAYHITKVAIHVKPAAKPEAFSIEALGGSAGASAKENLAKTKASAKELAAATSDLDKAIAI
jgi:hypothetical protein